MHGMAGVVGSCSSEGVLFIYHGEDHAFGRRKQQAKTDLVWPAPSGTCPRTNCRYSSTRRPHGKWAVGQKCSVPDSRRVSTPGATCKLLPKSRSGILCV